MTFVVRCVNVRVRSKRPSVLESGSLIYIYSLRAQGSIQELTAGEANSGVTWSLLNKGQVLSQYANSSTTTASLVYGGRMNGRMRTQLLLSPVAVGVMWH